MTRYKQKTEIFLVTIPPTSKQFDSCFWFIRKDEKGLHLQELKLKLFSHKNDCQITSKIVATKWSFTDHLKYEIANKQLAEYPQQNFLYRLHISWRTFNCYDYFLRHLRLLEKWFWPIWNSTNLIFQSFRGNKENKFLGDLHGCSS